MHIEKRNGWPIQIAYFVLRSLHIHANSLSAMWYVDNNCLLVCFVVVVFLSINHYIHNKLHLRFAMVISLVCLTYCKTSKYTWSRLIYRCINWKCLHDGFHFPQLNSKPWSISHLLSQLPLCTDGNQSSSCKKYSATGSSSH